MNTTLYGEIKKLAQKWKQYPNEYNPDDPNNRQILIEKNLKMAVGVALKYRGMGLTEDELISAATLGLCAAYEKYNPDKVVLRNKLLAAVTDVTTPEEFTELVANLMPYGGKVAEMFANQKPQTPEEMRQWVYNNIKPAKFSSVAYMWIKAYVLSDLDKYAKPVRVSEKDRGDVFFDSIDEGELYFCNKITYKESDWEEREEKWSKLMDGVPSECQRVLEMRYGIGCDEPMTLREIAAEVGRDVRWVKRCLVDCEDTLKWNAIRHKLDIGKFLG